MAHDSAQKKVITSIDIAARRISSERSQLGSFQSRLTSTINNLMASESRIRDLDVSKETLAFKRAQIMSQADTAQLAQANAMPQAALQLLS